MISFESSSRTFRYVHSYCDIAETEPLSDSTGIDREN